MLAISPTTFVLVATSLASLPPVGQPVIMVGAGTGLAPFRGFLQELRHRDRPSGTPHGDAELFFGCQNSSKFLYETELKGYATDKTLASLNVCFSRMGEKKYVQKEIVNRKAQVWKMLCDGAHIYVCGDASRMAPAVKSAFKTVASEEGGLSEAKASSFVDQLCAMGDNKRYHEDVWAGNA